MNNRGTSKARHGGTGSLTTNPFMELMIKSSEIALAAGQTIGYRTLMMAGANAAALTPRERREFSRMYTEKLQAMADYGQIMAREMMRLNEQFAMMAWSELVSAGMAMTSLATGQNPADAFTAQTRLINAAGKRASDASQKISTAMTRVAVEGIAPVHSAVTANARRLARRKR
jgi:hypothetical protein